VPTDLLAMVDYAAARSATDLARALAVAVQAGQWLTRTIAPFDGLLMPTTPQTAFPMDAPVPGNQADFTALANMSGAPAISLPLPVGSGQLPIGLQIIGRRGADFELLDAASRTEAALR
jgi:aspartyl-tRNA(Asn)/glutamyl-tRNA(Gln) amidotransferase subunit A